MKININFGKLRMTLIELEADELVKYQATIENFLSHEKDVVSSQFQELNILKNEGYDEDYLSVLEDSLIEEFQSFSTRYTNSFRSSVIVRTYSFLEYNLNEFCDYIYKTHNLKFKSHDLKGSSDIEKSKIYLKKACNIDFGVLDPEWNFVNNVRLLRNKIVHSSGEFQLVSRTNENPLATFIAANNSLSVIKNEEDFINEVPGTYEVLIKDEKLNLEFIENVRKLFKKLTTELFD